MEFHVHNERDRACASPTSPRRAAKLESEGVEFDGETLDTGRLPHGVLLRPGRQRADAAPPLRPVLRRLEAVTMAHRGCSSATTRCRFPTRRTSRGASPTSRASTLTLSDTTGVRHRDSVPPRRCSTSTWPGWRTSPRPAIEIERAPEGITFEPLPTSTSACYALVGWDEKFAAHNAARLGARPARRRAAGRRARQAALRADRELGRRRLALLAPARRRRGGLALLADRGVRVRRARPRRLLERRRRALRRGQARSSSTSRCRTSRRRPGTSRRTTRASSATPSSTGSPAASARRRARSGSRTTSPARARRRA